MFTKQLSAYGVWCNEITRNARIRQCVNVWQAPKQSQLFSMAWPDIAPKVFGLKNVQRKWDLNKRLLNVTLAIRFLGVNPNVPTPIIGISCYGSRLRHGQENNYRRTR